MGNVLARTRGHFLNNFTRQKFFYFNSANFYIFMSMRSMEKFCLKGFGNKLNEVTITYNI